MPRGCDRPVGRTSWCSDGHIRPVLHQKRVGRGETGLEDFNLADSVGVVVDGDEETDPDNLRLLLSPF
jgi:hypothetical protein